MSDLEKLEEELEKIEGDLEDIFDALSEMPETPRSLKLLGAIKEAAKILERSHWAECGPPINIGA